MTRFPKDFLWGVACASYQCEGAWDVDGKGRSIWDDFCHDLTAQHIKNGDTGDVACDSYHRFREDAALMQAHGVKAYRFSVSWPRVIPDGDGEVNEKGFRFYDELVDELIKRGIEPLVTLYHWDLPSALQDKGGWLSPDIVAAFGRYAEIVAGHFRGRVRHFMTINEPECITVLGHGSGVHAPGLCLSEEKQAQIFHHIALAHSEAQRRIKAVSDGGVRVGIVPCGRLCYPERDTLEDRESAYRASFDLSRDRWGFTFNIVLDSLIHRRYDPSAPEPVKRFAARIPASDWERMETPDFLGVNIYNGELVDRNGAPAKLGAGFPLTACKWLVTPEVMHYGPVNLYRRYGLPIYITENGQSCNDRIFLDGQVHDPDRIDFLHRYLLELHKAIEEGVPVLGYLQWSFLDNFEWSEGYNERFGLVYVDYPSLRRIPKDSARWYREVIETNGACLFTPENGG